MEQYDFFVSHANEDAEYARELVTALEARGVRCWIAPRDIPAGSDYGSEIVRAIQASRSMLLIMSAKANEAAHERKHILRELEEASNFRKPIYPLRLEPIELHDSLRYRLSVTQWIEAIADRDRLSEMLIKILRNEAIDMPPALARKAFRAPSGLRLAFLGIAAIVLTLISVPFISRFYFEGVERSEARKSLLGYGYELTSGGMEQAIRKNDMQSVVWFRLIGISLSQAQVDSIVIDDLKRPSSLTPIWTYLIQAGASAQLTAIRREIQAAVSIPDALNQIFISMCSNSATEDSFFLKLKNAFPTNICESEANWYAFMMMYFSRIASLGGENKQFSDFVFTPKNSTNILLADYVGSTMERQSARILKMQLFVVVKESQVEVYDAGRRRLTFWRPVPSQIINLDKRCLSGGSDIGRMCRADFIFYSASRNAVSRRSNFENQLSEAFLNTSILSIKNVTPIESAISTQALFADLQAGYSGWRDGFLDNNNSLLNKRRFVAGFLAEPEKSLIIVFCSDWQIGDAIKKNLFITFLAKDIRSEDEITALFKNLGNRGIQWGQNPIIRIGGDTEARFISGAQRIGNSSARVDLDRDHFIINRSHIFIVGDTSYKVEIAGGRERLQKLRETCVQ